MIKKFGAIFLALLLLTGFIVTDRFLINTVWGLDTNQTIPTRTPTPPPATPTQSGGGGGGGGSNPTATKSSSQATSTATSTLLPVKIAPTPVGGFLPTAVPCSDSPTIQTLGATNVRSGPGLEYEVIGQLVYLEVRYIVGRAETAEWWLIQFNNGQFGWVADDIVLVQGYTPIVPIVEAPPLDGSTPTPGASWNPTPIPFCTVTPVPTDTPTATVTPPGSELAEAEAAATETATPTEPAPTEVIPTDTPIVQPTAVPPQPTATLATATEPPAEGNGNGLILVGIGILIAAGLGVFFVRRRG